MMGQVGQFCHLCCSTVLLLNSVFSKCLLLEEVCVCDCVYWPMQSCFLSSFLCQVILSKFLPLAQVIFGLIDAKLGWFWRKNGEKCSDFDS